MVLAQFWQNTHESGKFFMSNSGRLPEIPGELVVEQIIAYVRRIVQIMIEATDWVQMLYRGVTFQEKTRATQNFNMAAIFQYGCHGLS